MEDLLLRTLPELEQEWEGATAPEIDAIERIAGRPLPRFYRWFLTRMGKSMGPMSWAHVDFSAQTVLESYAKGDVTPLPGFLMIGLHSNLAMRLHYYYNLDLPARDDARVTRMDPLEGPAGASDQFETLREMFGRSVLRIHRMDKLPQRCNGWFEVDGGDVCSTLDPIMSRLGFTRPIPTGLYCGLYERADAVLTCSDEPRDEPESQVFYLGGEDEVALRRILGAIAMASVQVEIRDWTPPLP
ncbi:MAG: SMI1/KNR4 family protein [Luteimonas sp.]|nr:SMI1/KNR4 family protein [Luteimonas sp.]